MAWSIYLKVADVLQSFQKIWSSSVSYKKIIVTFQVCKDMKKKVKSED